MSARFERMCEESEQDCSMDFAFRIKRLFEATRNDPPKKRQLVNDGLKAVSFILSSMERELGVQVTR